MKILSCDTAAGVPFNVASYAILTHMVAQVTNMTPGEFVWMGGDIHLYSNHVEGMQEQITREPYPFPTITLNQQIKNLFNFTYNDITIENYRHHEKIPLEIAV